MENDKEKEPIFFHPKSGKIFMHDSKKIQCSNCNRYIDLYEVFARFRSIEFHNKKAFKYIDYFCNDNNKACWKVNKLAIFYDFNKVNYTDFIPEGCIYYQDLPPMLSGFSDSGTVIDAALGKHIFSDDSFTTIIDHTRLAGKESWEGAKIGRDVTAELEEKDRPRTVHELNDYFKKLITSDSVYMPIEWYDKDKDGKLIKKIIQKEKTEMSDEQKRLMHSWDEKAKANPEFKLSQNDIDQLLGRKSKQLK